MSFKRFYFKAVFLLCILQKTFYFKKEGDLIYKNKACNGRNNIAGVNIAKIRKQLIPKTSQRALADKMQLEGIELDKNAIQRIESGQRFITDIELKAFTKVLHVSYDELLNTD